jgi:hypothetical protein
MRRAFPIGIIAVVATYAHAQFANPTAFPSPPAVESVTITGAQIEQFLGRVTSAVGDVNGDGLADFAVGAPEWAPGATPNWGACYVLFGSSSWASATSFDVSTLNGTRGFVIRGASVAEGLGSAVEAAGDVNGDGYGDIVIGCPGMRDLGGALRGGAYVLFGGPNVGAGGVIQASSIQGTLGFRALVPKYSGDGGRVVAGLGDVDGDGYDDCAVTDSRESYPEPSISLGSNETRFIATGDLDNDGDDDFVVSQSQAQRVVLFFNLGNMQFSAVNYPVATWPEHVELADMDNDGDLDLVVASHSTSGGAQISVLKNLASGLFGSATNYTSGSTYLAYKIADINGDGYRDVVMSTFDGYFVPGSTSTMYVLTNNGSGGFQTSNALITGDEPRALAVGDFDGDGDVDLVANSGNPTGQLVVIANQGSGLFAPPVFSPGLGGTDAMEAADIDGDGDLDLVVGSTFWVPNNGMQFSGAHPMYYNSQSGRLIIRDLDGDGDPDFITGGISSNAVFGVNQGTGTFTVHLIPSTAFAVTDAAVGDFDSDGLLDVIFTHSYSGSTFDISFARGRGPCEFAGPYTGGAYVLKGGPNVGQGGIVDLATLSPSQGFIMRGRCANELLGAGIAGLHDIDADGIDDFEIGSYDGHATGTILGGWSVVRGTAGLGSAGVFDLHTLSGANGFVVEKLVVPASFGGVSGQPCDFDGDGWQDLVFGAPSSDYGPNNSWGAVYVAFGSPTMGSAGNLALSSPDGLSSIECLGWQMYDGLASERLGCGDINGDGFDDVLIGAEGNDEGSTDRGAVFVVYGRPRPYPTGVLVLNTLNGSNGFRMLGGSTGGKFGKGPRVVGDVDGDGIDDMLIGEYHYSPQGSVIGRAYLILGQRYGAPTIYCTAKTNSLNCVPAIGWSGNLPSVTDVDPFYISATNLLNQKPGIAFYSLHGRNVAPFQGGTLCVKSPLRRTPMQSSGGNSTPTNDCSGTYSINWRAWMHSGADLALTAGVTIDAQYYSRDPSSSFTVGLTNGIEFTIGP